MVLLRPPRAITGFVGADLTALIKEAAAIAVTRIFADLEAVARSSVAAVASAAAAAAAAAAPETTMTMPMTGVEVAAVAVATVVTVAADVLLPGGGSEDPSLLPAVAAPTVDADAAIAAIVPAPPIAAATAAISAAPMSATVTVAAPPAAAAAAAAAAPSSSFSFPERLLRFGGGPLTAAELQGLSITMGDFDLALPKVQPSVRREGFTTTPDVTWEDVGSLDEVRARDRVSCFSSIVCFLFYLFGVLVFKVSKVCSRACMRVHACVRTCLRV